MTAQGIVHLPLTCDVQGVTHAYNNIVPSLTFAGPTYLSPVLQQTIELTQREVDTDDSQFYFVLLIITVSPALAS